MNPGLGTCSPWHKQNEQHPCLACKKLCRILQSKVYLVMGVIFLEQLLCALRRTLKHKERKHSFARKCETSPFRDLLSCRYRELQLYPGRQLQVAQNEQVQMGKNPNWVRIKTNLLCVIGAGRQKRLPDINSHQRCLLLSQNNTRRLHLLLHKWQCVSLAAIFLHCSCQIVWSHCEVSCSLNVVPDCVPVNALFKTDDTHFCFFYP